MTPKTMDQIHHFLNSIRTAVQMVRNDEETVKANGDPVEIIRHYDHLRNALDLIKESREALQFMADILSKDTIPDVLRKTGVKTITVEGVGRVSVAHRFSCTMLDKEKGFEYLHEIGQEGLIQETVNSSTLSAFARSWLEDKGKELPSNIFKTSIQAHTSITKVK